MLVLVAGNIIQIPALIMLISYTWTMEYVRRQAPESRMEAMTTDLQASMNDLLAKLGMEQITGDLSHAELIAKLDDITNSLPERDREGIREFIAATGVKALYKDNIGKALRGEALDGRLTPESQELLGGVSTMRDGLNLANTELVASKVTTRRLSDQVVQLQNANTSLLDQVERQAVDLAAEHSRANQLDIELGEERQKSESLEVQNRDLTKELRIAEQARDKSQIKNTALLEELAQEKTKSADKDTIIQNQLSEIESLRSQLIATQQRGNDRASMRVAEFDSTVAEAREGLQGSRIEDAKGAAPNNTKLPGQDNTQGQGMGGRNG